MYLCIFLIARLKCCHPYVCPSVFSIILLDCEFRSLHTPLHVQHFQMPIHGIKESSLPVSLPLHLLASFFSEALLLCEIIHLLMCLFIICFPPYMWVLWYQKHFKFIPAFLVASTVPEPCYMFIPKQKTNNCSWRALGFRARWSSYEYQLCCSPQNLGFLICRMAISVIVRAKGEKQKQSFCI